MRERHEHGCRWQRGHAVWSNVRGIRGSEPGRGQLGWGEALRLAAPRWGAVHSFESWSDPGPMLTHARGLARRLAHPDAIRW